MSVGHMQSHRSSPGLLLRLATCAAITLAACRQAAGRSDDAPPTGVSVPAVGVVLPTSEGQRLLTYCDGSRAEADSMWVPSDAELRVVELGLNEHLKTEASEIATADALQKYSRQYLGLYRGGEKLVFVRGVSQNYLTRAVTFDTLAVPQSVKVASVIRRFGESAINVCDGGRGFFRAEYSLKTQRISRFAFQDYTG